MKTKAIIITYKGKKIGIFELKDVEPLEFLKIQKECSQNLDELENAYQTKMADLKFEIESLNREIKHLKGED